MNNAPDDRLISLDEFPGHLYNEAVHKFVEERLAYRLLMHAHKRELVIDPPEFAWGYSEYDDLKWCRASALIHRPPSTEAR